MLVLAALGALVVVGCFGLGVYWIITHTDINEGDHDNE
jgi:hypothetical protein